MSFELYNELLLIVWWPEEKAKGRKLFLESSYPYALALLNDMERLSTRLRNECLHPLDRAADEDQLQCEQYEFQSARKRIEYLMRFAGGSTNLDKRESRSMQAKPKVQDSSYNRLKKLMSRLTHPNPLHECVVARCISSITLGKPRCKKCKRCKVCGDNASRTHSQLKSALPESL